MNPSKGTLLTFVGILLVLLAVVGFVAPFVVILATVVDRRHIFERGPQDPALSLV